MDSICAIVPLACPLPSRKTQRESAMVLLLVSLLSAAGHFVVCYWPLCCLLLVVILLSAAGQFIVSCCRSVCCLLLVNLLSAAAGQFVVYCWSICCLLLVSALFAAGQCIVCCWSVCLCCEVLHVLLLYSFLVFVVQSLTTPPQLPF